MGITEIAYEIYRYVMLISRHENPPRNNNKVIFFNTSSLKIKICEQRAALYISYQNDLPYEKLT